jgi:hypothetical protein
MKLEKKYYIIIGIVIAIIIWYFYAEKNKNKEESGFKWPTWLKVGGCRPCAGSIHDGCCNGCVCKDKAMIKQ